ncbi:hypothetical protein H1191_07030 [Paenactinomyces guangxiensis]|uniref:Spore germination GerAC-like C-terminal domain-containing protein n=2 Tax=Paenactinomyces guangxiensis TaxID=1490290 RepID=A0A7W1WQA8_9BACL|nr:Ger(x)C family spore germination C-terminal domain-containing protein [Paenactinomyces guangxiensis]MBA4494055.1 hypothetical protein [Paenactinomyces guangxiensis]MBH8591200.1 hypothetical protein [Paenactinomyces guangxiensis]
MQTEVLKKAEKSLQNEIRSLVDQALRKIQKEYKADVAGFNDQLRIQYPKVWQKVKKDWDKRFSEPKVNYSVKVDIIDYGTKGSKK